jgi:hypothetical protein
MGEKNEPGDPRRLTATCVLLADEDLEVLRDLALHRARLKGGRVSQGAVVRDLIRAEAKRSKAREAARG